MITILIADDEKLERNGIKFLLKREQEELEILEAINGKDAAGILQKKQVDILFSDIKMPYMTGLELAKAARELQPEIEIVIFSGYNDFSYAKEALHYGVVDYVLKPVDPGEFHKTYCSVRDHILEKNTQKGEIARQQDDLGKYFLQNFLYDGKEENGTKAAELLCQDGGQYTHMILAGGEDCEGPDLILLPEVPFDQDKFLARVDELQRVKSNVIIAASEGVKTADGTYLCDLVSTAGQLDAFGHKAILSGTSRYLSDLIHDKLNCKSRAIEFSTLQRCASHLASRTDVNEAYAVGGAAAAAAFAGESGRMIALKRVSNYPYQCITESVDVQQVANLEKKVPLEWITPDGMQVTEAFEEYARPLILDEVTPVYVNGTPRHIRL